MRSDLAEGASIRSITPDDAPTIFSAVDEDRDYLSPWLPWVPLTQSEADTNTFVVGAVAGGKPAMP